MFQLILLTALLILSAAPADAAPVVAIVVSVASSVTAWFAAGSLLAQFTGYLLLSMVSSALLKPKASMRQEDVFKELGQPTSVPEYRFALGHCWAPGTPTAVRVKGRIVYACWILSSEPSKGPYTIFFDRREVKLSGNLHDFNSAGGVGTEAPFQNHVNIWIGKGDQTTPPKMITDEAPEFFVTSDGWRGRTVMWAKLNAGSNESFNDRWPAAPPNVTVEADWAYVWDPRDPSQDPDNRSTWKFSQNHALLALHVLRNNPLRPYPMRHLWIDSFKWAADVADSPLPVVGGGTIPRFWAGGVLAMAAGSEIEDLVNPLLQAGAARWLRTRGQLGILPATWSGPVGVIDDFLDEQEMTYERFRSEDELYTEAFARYTSPQRSWETATAPTYVVPGAEADDNSGPRPLEVDVPFCTDHRRAQYIAKIQVMRVRMQRSLSMMCFPKAADFLAGANVTVSFPSPYTGRNGIYEIQEINPGFDPLGQDDDGPVAMRVPVILRENSSLIYAWNPDVEEKPIALETFDPSIIPLDPPGAPSLYSNSTTVIESGTSVIPRVMMVFEPSDSASARGYEWQWATNPTNLPPYDPSLFWVTGGLIDADVIDGSGDVIGYTGAMNNGEFVNFRIRTLSSGGASDWVYSSRIQVSTGAAGAPPPTPISAISVDSGIEVSYRTPNESRLHAIEIFASNINSVASSSRIFGPVNVSQDSVFTRIETGLADDQTRYYWARSIDTSGQPSTFSAAMSATYEIP